jgi:replicative DNA helicase
MHYYLTQQTKRMGWTLRLEQTIIKNLIKNEKFTRKVLPFLKTEYFSNQEDRLLFKEVAGFVLKYNQQPTFDALEIEIDNIRGSTDETVKSIKETLKELNADTNLTNEDWLVESTEKFCQERAIYNAITSSLEIMNGKSKLEKGAIPQLLSDALAISFDPNIGHDYMEQSEDRYEYYHRLEERISFDLEFFNKITKNGVPKKTLNVVMAGVGVGKSLTLCHFAASYLSMGKNVLYISLELAEQEVSKRIDANLMNITLDDLMLLPKDVYKSKIEKLKQKTHGKLIVKEYATSTASTTHFRSLLNELNLKKNFVPDVIMVDYLNICASSRIKPGVANSYTYIKAIAEELRGLAVEFNVPVWSATQLTRSGYGSSDPDLTDTSESFGLPATADFFIALVTNETMEQLKQYQVKQLKNRYNDPSMNKRFVIGVDRAKMKLYDVEQSAQDLADSGQEQEELPKPVFDRNKSSKFKGLKV